MELFEGAICNLGSGISTGIANVAAEEGVLARVCLTNEQGNIGGAPVGAGEAGRRERPAHRMPRSTSPTNLIFTMVAASICRSCHSRNSMLRATSPALADASLSPMVSSTSAIARERSGSAAL